MKVNWYCENKTRHFRQKGRWYPGFFYVYAEHITKLLRRIRLMCLHYIELSYAMFNINSLGGLQLLQCAINWDL